MGKRKRHENEDLLKRIRKLEGKIREQEETRSETPPLPFSIEEVEEGTGNYDIPEELLMALGQEGEEIEIVGEAIQPQLVSRWTNIIQSGLSKEDKAKLIKKYPTPANFSSAVPPKLNAEIAASLSEITVKRDKRICYRQMLIGKMMIALGKTLSSVLKGSLNTKEMVEQLNDSAKLAAEVYHQNSSSRKYFALAGTTAVVKEAVKNIKTDEFLFGKDCGDRIKTAQAIKRTSAQIKVTSNRPRVQENWKSPLQGPSQYRSGQTYRPQVRTRPAQPAQRYQPYQRTQTVPTPRAQTARKQPLQPQKPAQARYRRYKR